MKKGFALVVLFLGLSIFFLSCSVSASKFDPEKAKDFVANMTYVKDERTGICFAMVASRKGGDTDQSGIGVAYVPCEEVEHLLID